MAVDFDEYDLDEEIDLAKLPIVPKGRYAPERRRQLNEQIPKEFSTLVEAGIFWDTHSVADYISDLREINIEFDIQNSQFLIPIDGDLYRLLKDRAALEQRTISDMITILLQRELRI